ncbi:hypothetical protein WKW80_22775 [Variovorax humicola]|uniref:Alpha/beta hydrolase n=1 Tax=Variovorax humicola TaxID=1769758 RepID=A0ABU8W5D8_9BURK
MKNIDSSFESKDLCCAGTLLLPGQGECPPVIVMAHGFAGVRAAACRSVLSRSAS